MSCSDPRQDSWHRAEGVFIVSPLCRLSEPHLVARDFETRSKPTHHVVVLWSRMADEDGGFGDDGLPR